MKRKISPWIVFIVIAALFSQSILYAGEKGESLKEILGDGVVTYKLLQEKQARLMKYCSNNFKDYKAYKWYGKTVAMMVGTEKVGGYPDGTLRLDREITQAEVLKVLLSGEEFDTEVKEGEKWYTPVVRYAIEKGVVINSPYYDMMQHDYNKPATRMDVARYIFNYLGLKPSQEAIIFEDVNAVDGKIVQALYDELLITGYDENGKKLYKPLNTITRAEAFSMLINLIGYSEDKEAYKAEKLENKAEQEIVEETKDTHNPELKEQIKNEPKEWGHEPGYISEHEHEEHQQEHNPVHNPENNVSQKGNNSQLTQKQQELLESIDHADFETVEEFVDDYGKEAISKFINISKNYIERTYTFDYCKDFESYYAAIEPYSVGDYNDRLWFKREYNHFVEHKVIMEVRFLTDENYVYRDNGSICVRGIVQYRLESVEGDFAEHWVKNYSKGKWYEVPFDVYVGTGLKGDPFVNYYVHGFHSIGDGRLVEGE